MRVIYINACEVAPQRISLIEMVHPQLRTPIQTNNFAAHSFVMKISIQEEKGYGYTFPLVEVLRFPRVLQVLLATVYK